MMLHCHCYYTMADLRVKGLLVVAFSLLSMSVKSWGLVKHHLQVWLMPMLIRCSALVADIKVASSVVMLQLHSRVRAIVGLVIQIPNATFFSLRKEIQVKSLMWPSLECGIKLWWILKLALIICVSCRECWQWTIAVSIRSKWAQHMTGPGGAGAGWGGLSNVATAACSPYSALPGRGTADDHKNNSSYNFHTALCRERERTEQSCAQYVDMDTIVNLLNLFLAFHPRNLTCNASNNLTGVYIFRWIEPWSLK